MTCHWPLFLAVENYFNYFTDVEECYRRCRETPSLLSPLDWALIESWKEAGIPVAAVLVGIERAFKKFHKRPRRFRKVNTLAYCTQEVMRAAEEAQAGGGNGGGASKERGREAAPPFSVEDILAFLNRNAGALEQASHLAREKAQPLLEEDLAGAARSLREIMTRETGELRADPEDLERRLTALEEKLTASLTYASSVELLAEFRREVDRGLVPYRRKMSGAQIESMERQFLKKRLFEYYRIPRLSLFYL